MKPLFFLFISLTTFAQTRIHPDQMVLPEFRSPEEAWCPGPSMQVQANRLDLLVGRNWSTATPCYMHFNITPPASVDPISVSSQVEPFMIQIKAGFTGDDEIYLYALAPVFSPVTPAKIQVRVRSLASVTCSGCPVIADTRTPRTFPPNSVPIGFALIRGGKFLPKADELLNRQQVFIGPGAEMAVRADQGGYWFEASAAIQATANLAQRAAALELTRAAMQERVMKELPPPEKQLKDLTLRLSYLEGVAQDLLVRVPPSAEETRHLTSQWQLQIEQMREDVQRESQYAYARREEMYGEMQASMRVDPPKGPNEICTDRRYWAIDSKFLYRCLSDGGQLSPENAGNPPIYWTRMEVDRKWKPVPLSPPPPASPKVNPLR